MEKDNKTDKIRCYSEQLHGFLAYYLKHQNTILFLEDILEHVFMLIYPKVNKLPSISSSED